VYYILISGMEAGDAIGSAVEAVVVVAIVIG
jgi:hypothetical protein